MPEQEKQVRDIMTDVFEFPHVPYWFTFRQVAGILKKTISGGKCLRPLAVLVFDEKYNFMGHLDVSDILGKMANSAFPDKDDRQAAGLSFGDGAGEALKTLSEKPVSSIVKQPGHFVDPEDQVLRAAALMLRNNLSILPVLENRKKLVGIVRSVDIFDHLSALFFRA